MRKFNLLILVFSFFASNIVGQEKQNVLMIVLDDLNNYVGFMEGHPQAKTPNIDKLAEEGVAFTNAHSNVPVCQPSRASFMNGIHPAQSGLWGFGKWLKNEKLVNSKSLPEYFRDNGYKAYQTGKIFHTSKPGVWNEMGVFPDYGPMAYDGKKSAGHPSCPEAMLKLGPLDATFAPLSDVPKVEAKGDAPGYNGWYNTSYKAKSPFRYEGPDNRDMMTDEKSSQYVADKLKQLEESNSEEPFYIAAGLIRPHTPLVVPQKYFDMFPLDEVKIPVLLENDVEDTKLESNSDKPSRGSLAYKYLTESYSSEEEALRNYVRAYLASVAFADEQVGKMLDALEKSKFKDNTTVVLFSDHGYNLGEKEYLFKYALWEESTHVPLIIKTPGNEKSAGNKIAYPVSLIDVYPTLKDLCGLEGDTKLNAKGGKLDGESLKTLLFDENAQWEDKNLALTMIASWKNKNAIKQHIAVRSKDFRYILYYNGEEELYDHRNDKHEWNNLANNPEYSKIKKELKNQLKKQISEYSN